MTGKQERCQIARPQHSADRHFAEVQLPNNIPNTNSGSAAASGTAGLLPPVTAPVAEAWPKLARQAVNWVGVPAMFRQVT